MAKQDRNEIIALEKSFWQTMVDKDVDTATAMMEENCVVTGPMGAATIGRKTFSKMMAEGKWELRDFDFEDVQILFPADDIAVVGYKVREQLKIDGKPLTLEAADASTWVRHGDTWLCALHTESILGDPFGRDKAAVGH